MSEERRTMKNCRGCWDAPLWTDGDIEWCNKCDYSAAVAAQPKHHNQYTRKVNPEPRKAQREAPSK